MNWTNGWPGWLLSGIIILAVPVAVAVALHDLDWAAVVPPAAAVGLAAGIGALIHERGVRGRPEEKPRDRQLGWSWHHPVRSAVALALLYGSLLALYSGLFAGDVDRVWLAWPIFAAAWFVGGILARFLPLSYTGEDPDVPERWRRPPRRAERPIPRRDDPRDQR